MKKIYMRAGMSPLEPIPIGKAVWNNTFGENSGNLIYQYSVFRALMREDTQFYARDFTSVYDAPGGVEQLNETCDCAVFTLANAFRKGYRIADMADMVRKLKIPTVVVGCGVQADSLEQIRAGLPFDDDVRSFVDAVLDKSAMLGLRGELSAEYLKHLGYLPEQHFTVIGCPSLFLNGPVMPEPKPVAITPDTRFNITTRPAQRREMHELIFNTERQYPNYHLVMQRRRALRMLAFGIHNRDAGPTRDFTGYYPFDRHHPDVVSGKVLGFTEARTWFEYMKGVDYSFGSRIHGNIAAVINGVPAYVFTPDTRTEEICRFANIPFTPIAQLKGGEDIRDFLEKADFRAVCRGHEERFRHYVDFLNLNGLDHIYRETDTPAVVPFDEAMKAVPVGGLVRRGCIPLTEQLWGRARYLRDRVVERMGRH